MEQVKLELERERVLRLEQQIASLERVMEARLEALALAVRKQEDAYNIRFAGVNEFRASLNDALNRSVTREYVDIQLGELARRVGALENRFANLDGRIAIVGIVTGLIAGAVVSLVVRLLGG